MQHISVLRRFFHMNKSAANRRESEEPLNFTGSGSHGVREQLRYGRVLRHLKADGSPLILVPSFRSFEAAECQCAAGPVR